MGLLLWIDGDYVAKHRSFSGSLPRLLSESVQQTTIGKFANNNHHTTHIIGLRTQANSYSYYDQITLKCLGRVFKHMFFKHIFEQHLYISTYLPEH